MDALFNGECGFTLKCTDGRSVELVPKADCKTEPTHEIRTETHGCVKDTHDKDEPQTGVSYSDHTDYDEPKTYVTWTEPQTEGADDDQIFLR